MSLTQVRSLIEGLYDAAVLLNPDFRPIAYNSRYANMTGLRPSELRAQIKNNVNGFELLSADGEIDRTNAKTSLETRAAVHLAEQQVKNATGELFTAWISFIPVFQAEGDLIGLIEIIRDVTGEARTHSQLKEVLALTKARADDLEQAVEQRTRELTIALEHVTRLSRTDALTGLLNRRSFREQAMQAIDLATRHKRTVAILMCDLDHFKKLNDTHGHLAGDAVLTGVAGALVHTVRESDRVARFGGEEFVILLSETSAASVLEVAQRCNRAIRDLPILDLVPGATAPQTISIGIAVFPEHGATLDELIAHADQALYWAKESGRDQSVTYDRRMSEDHVSSISHVRRRILIVDSDPIRMQEAATLLGRKYDVVTAPTSSFGLTLCTHGHYDAIIADQELSDEGGIEFFGKSLAAIPGSLRVLSVDKEDFYLAVRATNFARVDYFLLRKDGLSRIVDVVDDVFARREIVRDQLLAGHSFSRGSFVVGLRELERILLERTLGFAFQPIMRAPDRTCFGYEILCRPPKYFNLGPGELFEVAVRSGHIWRLGRLLRETLGPMLTRIPEPATLFINMHPAEIEDPQLTDERSPLEPYASRIVFEITERGAIANFTHFKAHMEKLQARGYRFAVDDLGAGYAGLSSLALLEPDFLKIDMSIVHEIHRSQSRASLVRRIVDYSNDQGIRVVAEGIETAEEAQAATDLGCHLLQGYHLGYPAAFESMQGSSAQEPRRSQEIAEAGPAVQGAK